MPFCNLGSTRLRLFVNPRATRGEAYRNEGRDEILSLAAFADAKREITSWPGYKPTPLRRLSKLAAGAGVGDILYKDEGERFGLGSFKALGGAYAVLRLIQRHMLARKGRKVSSQELMSRRLPVELTVTAATDGNHGRAVAWGARLFGCRCVIYLPENASEGRARAIASYGAEVRRVPGTFDDAVRQAAADAAAEGWQVVSDISYEGCTDAPRDVMQGYALLIDEALAQCPAAPSHVFVQGGVGGVAAGVCSYLWEQLGAERPRFVVVEPENADCSFRSAVAGRPTPAEGALDTIMAGLACGEVSPMAWRILESGADAFATIDDEAAIECMRLLAENHFSDGPIVAGESAVAGLAALLLACADPADRKKLDLGSASRILVFGTEGATDPDTYRALVGFTPEDVLGVRQPG